MDVLCHFKIETFGKDKAVYCCYIRNQIISQIGELKFTGKHLPNYTNSNVVDVIFVNCDIRQVPQGLTKVFPNMQDLSVWNSNLKVITNNDLKEYKNLLRFAFCNTQIENLFGDLFEGFKNIEEVVFSDNKNLKFVEPSILDDLPNLNMVNFTGSSKFIKKFSTVKSNLGNATLDEVKAELYMKFCSDPENVKIAYRLRKLKSNTIRSTIAEKDCENQKLKATNDALQNQVQELNQQKGDLLKNLEKEKAEHSALKMKYGNGISNNIKQHILDDNFKDFTVVIDDREFRVHKFLLIAQSPTLAEVFKNNPHVENLNLIDIPVEIFERVLSFIYTDELPCDNEINYLQLFAAAGRLKIIKLKEFAASKILSQINPENALEVLKLSNRYDNNELRIKAFIKLKEMYPKMPFVNEWAFEPEQVKKAIELFKEKEEAIRKIEENFWNQMKTN